MSDTEENSEQLDSVEDHNEDDHCEEQEKGGEQSEDIDGEEDLDIEKESDEKVELLEEGDDQDSKKRGHDDANKSEASDNKSRKILKTVKVIRVLCPNYAVGSILGKGGERLKQFKDSTGARITVSKQGSTFPVLNERYVSIMADLNTIQNVVKFVQLRIRDDEFKPKDDREKSRFEKRKKVCRLVVSDNVIGKIIGKGGDNINELKVRHSVMIKTTNKKELPHNLPERVITIEGDQDRVNQCIDEIIADIHEDPRSNLEFFVDYAKYLRHSSSTSSQQGHQSKHQGPPPPHYPPPHQYPGYYSGQYPNQYAPQYYPTDQYNPYNHYNQYSQGNPGYKNYPPYPPSSSYPPNYPKHDDRDRRSDSFRTGY